MNNMFEEFVIKPLIRSIKSYPDNNAFCINETFYTYKQFGVHISKIRTSINKLDKKSPYFGLVVNDDIETYAAIFALWLEGKAYIPLHPNQPFERNEEIITQMGIHNILDSNEISSYANYKIINSSKLTFAKDNLEYDKKSCKDDAITYILFTSGSTGKPKGVMLNRKNIGAFMDSFWATGIEISENDRCLQTFDLTFDVSVQSFLAPLTRGACVFTVPHDQIKYSYVFGLLEDHQLTFGVMAPSMLRYLRPYFDEIDLPNMKACIVTAEASPLDLVLEWQKCIPNAKVFDFYGPTEATIYCTYYEVTNSNNKALNGMLSIGKPLKNVEAIIVDTENSILSKGEKGELCVSGDQITPGYWNNPEKNLEAFFEKEFKGVKRRFYHTGDLCYLEEDDNLMLYGRLDSQVKIQGYRVELGEIEYHARTYLNGVNAVVSPFTNKTSNTELAIFIEAEEFETNSLINYLKTKLPPYMIPTKTICEKNFPLNANGKIDKLKLKDLIKQQ